MENKPEQTSAYDRITSIMKALFLVLLFLFFLYSLYYFIRYKDEDMAHRNTLIYVRNWTNAADDHTDGYLSKDQTYHYASDKTFTMCTTLPPIISDRCYLTFITQQDTEVKINGITRKDYKLSRVNIPGGSVKPVFVFAPIRMSDSGKKLSIIRHQYSKYNNTCVIPETVIGSMPDIYQYVYDRYGVGFILDLVLLASSVVIIIIGFLIKIRLKISVDMIYAGFALFLVAGWMATDSYYFPFAFGYNYIDGLLSYMLCLLIPLPFLAYFDSLQKRRHKKFFMIHYVLTYVNFALWTILHFTGILKFYDSLFAIDCFMIYVILASMLMFISEYRDGYLSSYRFTALGIVGYTFFAFLEIMMILIPVLENNGSMLLLGLLFLMAFVVIQQVYDFRATDAQRRRAVELSDAKTNFLASMSHEIRTPINSILGMNEMILRENHDPTIESYAETVQKSGRMLLSLVNDVLDFSKIEAGKLDITCADYRLSSLIYDISRIAQERCSQKELEYSTDIAGSIPDGLWGDEFRIKQILINFISNAVKYTDKGRVGLKVSGMYSSDDIFNIVFEVSDSGRGIKPEDQKTLFDAFSRIDLQRNRSIEGTGLGLAIVKSIVDTMNGSVNVTSHYGSGSTFSVTIPQKVTDRTAVPTNLSEMTHSVHERVRHVCDYTAPDAEILAVDDNEPNLVIVRQFLKCTKVRLDLCTNGNDAVSKCKHKKYDLILLDHMMPDPDGIETLKIIRSDAKSLNRETPAVMLTANAIAGTKQLYLDAGFIDHLTKPLDSSALEETVKRLIPSEKVIPLDIQAEADVDGISYTENDDGSFEFAPEYTKDPSKIKKPFDDIPEIDYEKGLSHSGGYDDILIPIMKEIAKEGPDKAAKMRKAVDDEDYDSYRLTAHSIKGTMATIGADGISEKAKLHEFAVKEGNFDLIKNEHEAFLNEYEALCKKILEELSGN